MALMVQERRFFSFPLIFQVSQSESRSLYDRESTAFRVRTQKNSLGVGISSVSREARKEKEKAIYDIKMYP